MHSLMDVPAIFYMLRICWVFVHSCQMFPGGWWHISFHILSAATPLHYTTAETMMVVWKLRVNITRSVLWCIVYNHKWTHVSWSHISVGLGLFRFRYRHNQNLLRGQIICEVTYNYVSVISQLPNLFIGTPRICNFILLLIIWVRSFSKMLPSVKFAESKVLVFVILHDKC